MSENIKKPFVFLCTAMSLDGKISNYKHECSPISTDDNRDLLYDSRIRADAVMIGGKTLIYDDSGLTVKSAKRQQQRLDLGKPKEPAKVVIISDASQIKIDGDFLNKGDAQKYIFTTKKTDSQVIEELKNHNCQVFVFGEDKVDLKQVMSQLVDLGIKTLMAEGGGELIFSLLKENLVDEINLKIGDIIWGGRNTATLTDGEGFSLDQVKKVELIDLQRQGNILILKYKVIK